MRTYWELYRRNAMPRETKNYVPQILAAAIMVKNPARYGLENVVAEAPLVTDTVGVDYAMDLRLAADVTGTTLANIVYLNPALLRLSTPAGIHYDMHVPQGTKAEFESRIAAIPLEKRSSWRFHEVRAGESLEQVSQLFHVSSHEIRVANDLSDADPVGEGDELVVPVQGAGQPSTRPLQYTARAGDSLVTIADRFNVSTGELREWNHMGAGDVGSGDVLYVSEPVRLPPAGRGHVRRQGRSYAAARRGRGGRGGAVRGGSKRGAARMRCGADGEFAWRRCGAALWWECACDGQEEAPIGLLSFDGRYVCRCGGQRVSPLRAHDGAVGASVEMTGLEDVQESVVRTARKAVRT